MCFFGTGVFAPFIAPKRGIEFSTMETKRDPMEKTISIPIWFITFNDREMDILEHRQVSSFWHGNVGTPQRGYLGRYHPQRTGE